MAIGAQTITIRSSGLILTVDPDRGGCITRLDVPGSGAPRPVLRPAAPEFAAAGDATEAAAFVTAPHFGPVTGGELAWNGRRWQLLHNHPDEPEPIHGDAWRGRWEVEAAEAASVTLSYAHVPVPGLYPAPYRVTQTLALDRSRLTVTLTLTNLAEAGIHAGLAWHPYFPLTPATRLGCRAEGLWSRTPLGTDRPVGPVPPAFRFDPARPWNGLEADDTFAGWAGTAVIAQPDLGLEITMTAGPPMRMLQVFSPAGADFLCVEPISNAPDAHRLAAAGIAGHGLTHLLPGDAIAASVTLDVADKG